MLVLNVSTGGGLELDNGVKIKLFRGKAGRCMIGVECPPEVKVVRARDMTLPGEELQTWGPVIGELMLKFDEDVRFEPHPEYTAPGTQPRNQRLVPISPTSLGKPSTLTNKINTYVKDRRNIPPKPSS
jgi:hypothetical protein